ncbi:S1 RNA-binding domain-containing protein [Candidatus Woesearchaeota archaeon]|nr:S1 RNA-binding domain-containing protein [Candidatus Woesearchaeota archaeon]
MLFIKEGIPQEEEIVFCTVTKIQYHSVFVSLDEYKNKSGMIHISEISPGRIRNIGDYVKEGKVIVCKVLRINKDRGHIDLSLRRVNESQRRAKVEERKQQAIAEAIIQSYAQNSKQDVKKVYNSLSKLILEEYDSIYGAFEDVVESGASLAEIGIDKDVATDLEALVKERIKPKEVVIEAHLSLESFNSNGVDIINDVVSKLASFDDKLKLQFLGAGKYKVEVRSREYKVAEDIVKQALEILNEGTKDSLTSYKFERD